MKNSKLSKKQLNKYLFFLLAVFVLSSFSHTLAGKKIYASDFNVNQKTIDSTPGIIDALKLCKKSGASELIFEKGIYHFYPDKGTDKYCFVSNNDEGLKRVVFLFEGFKNLTIDGQGSTFIFHGFVNPFVIENSSGITFKNFQVDCERAFHSEGIILASNEDEMDLEIPEQFPFRISNNILTFTNGEEENKRKTTVSKNDVFGYGSLLEFDTEKKETAFMVYDYYLDAPLVARSLGGNKVRIYLKGIKGTVGNTMVFSPNHRNYPGFILSDSRDIRFEKIDIHHSGGMGVVGQRTHNVTLESCNVVPSRSRMISCTADATHFTNCTGKIELHNCIFTNQMDDATNIHGIYVQISDIIAADEIMVELKHAQQLGFDFLKKGTLVEFVKGLSLITEGTANVIEAEKINKNFTRIKLSRNLPESIKQGDALGEVRNFPEIHIHGNYIGKNRARGMLLNCRGKTIVENNTFHSPGASILFEGDASYWFEQGGVSDCIIRNNVFDNCLFGVWGSAIIDVAAGIKEDRETSRYNKNIRIYGNTFRLFEDSYILHLYCVDNLIYKNNKIEYTNAYPARLKRDSLFKIEYSDNIIIEE